MPEPSALVVHSKPATRSEIVRLLEALGASSETAGDFAQARDRLRTGRYAVCLTDVVLADASGLELVEHIQLHYPALPTAVVTAEATMDAAVAALKAGAMDFLCLPAGVEDLRRVVSPVLAGAVPSRHGQERRTRHILLGDSELMRGIRSTISKLAQTDASVFISGESGTGKELAARLIHARSPRACGPFVAVNCGAIPQELMESELFGHKQGAFTGATAEKRGLFQAAAGGILFLDEVAELTAAMQVKLLRALQEKAIRPVGDTREHPVDVRVLSATHKDLESLVAQRAFRQDLFYRINVIPLHMPPLRDRSEDVSILVTHCLQRLARRTGETPPAMSDAALTLLRDYPFPGNVRELENILERALALRDDKFIRPADLRLPAARRTIPEPDESRSLDHYLADLERDAILRALEGTGWNRTRAARQLGISFRSLRYRLEKLELGID